MYRRSFSSAAPFALLLASSLAQAQTPPAAAPAPAAATPAARPVPTNLAPPDGSRTSPSSWDIP